MHGKTSRAGTPTRGIAPQTFVNYIENHDQICNSGFRASAFPIFPAGCYRALTALLLLAPATPMLFMGQEFGASSPFVFFADHKPELAKLVYKGRLEFVSQFPSLATAESQAKIPDPADVGTFEMCKLKLEERRTHQNITSCTATVAATARRSGVSRSRCPWL